MSILAHLRMKAFLKILHFFLSDVSVFHWFDKCHKFHYSSWYSASGNFSLFWVTPLLLCSSIRYQVSRWYDLPNTMNLISPSGTLSAMTLQFLGHFCYFGYPFVISSIDEIMTFGIGLCIFYFIHIFHQNILLFFFNLWCLHLVSTWLYPTSFSQFLFGCFLVCLKEAPLS